MISGYPVFPLPATDWFSFDWKIPLHHVKWHKNAVKVYAIDSTLDLNNPYTVPVWKWFSGWFTRLPYVSAVAVLGMGASFLGFISLVCVRFAKQGFLFIKNYDQVFIAAIACIAGIVFWLTNGPDLRLGFGFCLFFITLGCSWVTWYFLRDYPKCTARVSFAVLLVGLVYAYGSFLNGIVNHFFVKPLVPRVASQIVETRDMGNGVNLLLVNYVDSWNTTLPCAPLIEINALAPKLRGKTVKEGFRASQ